MPRWRFRILYFVLLPAIAGAAGIVGYYTWQTASQYARLGEETIVQQTLLLVRDKVDRIEQQIIKADNAVFDRIDLDLPSRIATEWLPRASEISPTAKAVMVLDPRQRIVAYAHRGSDKERERLRETFRKRIKPDLQLEKQEVGRLKHLHRNYDGDSHLVAHKTMRHWGRRYYAIVHHDTQYIVQEKLPEVFDAEEGKHLYNVVDGDNNRVFGPSLARAGEYLVGHRFPTTLYRWRLQVAPKQAPLLDAKGKSHRVNEVSLIGTSFAVILLGVGFLIYAADKERRLNALKSEFIANVSHELKTPLSVIRMFGELLMSGRVDDDEKKRQYLQIVCRESERLSALIENVLDFSALERGKQQYDLHEGDLVEVVERAMETFRYRMEREGAPVELRRGADIPKVRLDEQAVLLAVVNLLDNAVKHGHGTPVDLDVERVDDEVQVRVRDRGPGIPSEELKRVFERFYRGRRRGQARGSGIGLSIVRHIAEAHGGRAWAQNVPEGGAVVAFSVPVPKATTQSTRELEEPPGTAAEATS